MPNRRMESLDDLLFRSGKMIVGKSLVTSENYVTFDNRMVLAKGYRIVYFEFFGKWFTIVKIWNRQGQHTGYYCDIVMLPKTTDDCIEITDLFLDLWVSPDLRYKILDEDELEDALQKEWITRELYDRARRELKKLIRLVEKKKFPPPIVKELERKLRL